MTRIRSGSLAAGAAAVLACALLGAAGLEGRPQVQGQPPPPAGRGQPPPPPPPVVLTGLIVGRVIDAGSGQPVAGAIVTLNGGVTPAPPPPITPGASRPFVPPQQPPRVMTDQEGRFAFRYLARGNYTLTVSKPGYAEGAYARMRPAGPSRPLQLADNERVGDVTLRLFKYGVIAGRIGDEAGDPIVAATVRLYRRQLVAGRRLLQPTVSTQTDDRGVYRFGNQLPGQYVVVVPLATTSLPADFQNSNRDQNFQVTANTPGNENAIGVTGGRPLTADARFLLSLSGTLIGAPSLSPADAGGRPMSYPTTYYPAATTPSNAQVITIGSGEERNGVDFALAPVPASNISGALISPEGSAANYVLHLVPSDNGTLSFDPDVATAVTDSTGSFMFLAVPAGQYVIQTSRIPRPRPMVAAGGLGATAGPVGMQLTVAGAPAPTEPMLWLAAPVSVGGQDIQGLTLMLREGLTISGRVEFTGAGERPTAQRLAQMPISVEPADGQQRSNTTLLSRIEPNGTFKITGLLPGHYLVRGSAPPGWQFHSALAHGVDVADVPLDLTSKDGTGVVVRFSDRMSQIGGTVRIARPQDEEPSVVVFPADDQLWKSYGFSARRLRMTRVLPGTGSYTIAPLPAGDYYVVAIPAEFLGEWQDPAYLELLTRVASRVSVGEGEQRSQDLEVQVVKPPAIGREALRPAPALPLDPALPAVEAHGPFVPDDQTAAPPQRDRLNVEKPGTGSISGVVLADDSSNAPVRKVRVAVRGPELRTERTAMTDDEGRFTIPWLPPGQYTVIATKSAYLAGYHGARRAGRGPGSTITLAAGQSLTGLAIRMARGGVITGTVVDQFGQPQPSARLRLMQYQYRDGERIPVSTSGSGTMMTDDRGVYRIYGLMPGSYTIGVVPANAGPQAETRLLSDDEMRAAMMDLQRGPQMPPATDAGGRRNIPPAPPGALPVAPPSGRAIAYATVYYPGTVLEQDAGPIVVTAGQETSGIDFALQMVPTSRLEGSALLPDGSAPARVQMSLWTWSGTGASTVPVMVMPDAKFQARGVAPGKYALVAQVMSDPQQIPDMPGAPPLPPEPPTLQYYGYQELTLNGDDMLGMVLNLATGLTISGRVIFERKGAEPPDPGRVRVMLEPIGNAARTGLSFGTRAVPLDANGGFRLTGVTPGRYRFNALVSAPPGSTGPPAWTLKSAVVNGANSIDVPFEVQPGRAIDGATLTLTDQVTELTGTITNASGAAVPDLLILFFPTDRTLWASARRMRGGTRPGTDGTYKITNILPGEYFLAAVTDIEPGDWGDPAYMDQVAAGAIKLTFAEGEKKVQDLRTR
jgi:hypothetical protein